MSVVGNNIRALRELNGLTQQELADIAGVSRETVNKWETGSIGNVRTSNIDVLRKHFSLSVDDLRSEVFGLAAKQRRKVEGIISSAVIPSYNTPADQQEFVDVPLPVIQNHPKSFAITVKDTAMDNVLPLGCIVVCDPEIAPLDGAIVFVKLQDSESPLLRKLHAGSNKALLIADSHSDTLDDYVVDLDRLNLLGTAVWFQAASEL